MANRISLEAITAEHRPHEAVRTLCRPVHRQQLDERRVPHRPRSGRGCGRQQRHGGATAQSRSCRMPRPQVAHRTSCADGGNVSESTDAPVCVTGKVHATYDRAVAAIRNMQTNLPLTAMTPRYHDSCSQLVASMCSAPASSRRGRARTSVHVPRSRCPTRSRFAQPGSRRHPLPARRCRPVAFSHSGNTVEVVRLLEITRADGARTIAVTSNGNSRIAALVDHILATGPGKLPFHSLAITSRII